MTAALKVLASVQVASANTDTTVYTVPGGKAAKIQSIALHNSTGVPLVVTGVSVVPSGGSIDNTHRMLTSFVLSSYDTASQENVLSFAKGLFLDAGAYLSVKVDTAASVNVLVTGVEL